MGTEIDYTKYEATGKAWGSNPVAVAEPYEFTLSSGKPVLVKRIGIAEILSMGLLDTLDFFTKALSEDDKKPDAKPDQAGAGLTQALMGNFGKMEETINKVVQAGVVAPRLHAVPLHENARQAGLVYVDSVPFDERVELFSEIMDTEGLSSFREEPKAGVGDVPANESVQNPAVNDVGFAG
jgi:hypothetical protein